MKPPVRESVCIFQETKRKMYFPRDKKKDDLIHRKLKRQAHGILR